MGVETGLWLSVFDHEAAVAEGWEIEGERWLVSAISPIAVVEIGVYHWKTPALGRGTEVSRRGFHAVESSWCSPEHKHR